MALQESTCLRNRSSHSPRLPRNLSISSLHLSSGDISIGVTLFRGLEYLEEALDSALNQTVPVKMILCNDGWLSAYGPLYRDLLVYSWDTPGWLLRYNRQLLLLIGPQERVSRELYWVSKIFGNPAYGWRGWPALSVSASGSKCLRHFEGLANQIGRTSPLL